jgi:hypothetical protein
MKFRDVQIGQIFDFPDFLDCIKISPRKYSFLYNGERLTTEVGSVLVEVTNVR